jgi:hypothetical protein
MTASPEGCGVPEHPVECLCDVIITKPTTTKLAIPYEMHNGEAIAYFGKWNGTLLNWFELADIAWQAIHKYRQELEDPPVHANPSYATRYKRTMPDDAYHYLVEGIRDGKQPTPLRQELIDIFGVTIHKSYVTKLRQRLERRGEL